MKPIISIQNYDVNIQNARTLFAPVSQFSLGDQILSQPVKQKYINDNPDETIEFTEHPLYYQEKMILHWDKIFHAEECNFVHRPDDAIIYSIADEATELARNGIYPELQYMPIWVKEPIGINEFYVVVSFRNVRMRAEKNVLPEYVVGIVKALNQAENIKRVYIVGNDDAYQSDIDLPDKFEDYRKRLKLPEIAYLCKYAGLVVNKDNGIGHLAAAVPCKRLFTWGIKERRWFPKLPVENQLFCLMEGRSGLDSVCNMLSGILSIKSKSEYRKLNLMGN